MTSSSVSYMNAQWLAVVVVSIWLAAQCFSSNESRELKNPVMVPHVIGRTIMKVIPEAYNGSPCLGTSHGVKYPGEQGKRENHERPLPQYPPLVLDLGVTIQWSQGSRPPGPHRNTSHSCGVHVNVEKQNISVTGRDHVEGMKSPIGMSTSSLCLVPSRGPIENTQYITEFD